jgi:CPA2 family monovalent cation:H+ antiporter-2
MHDLSVIITLAGALAAALVFGALTQRLGLSTLVGYILAGVVVGPYTPGFVADARLASQMAEIGVILLMFGVGMHFHPQELLRVWRIAVPGAVVQSALAGAIGWALARAFGWSSAAGIVFGMALAVASTVVLIRMLVQGDRLATREGHVAVGWLIVEDLFTVAALVMLPALGSASGGSSIAISIASAIGLAALFALLAWAVGTRVVSPLMGRIARMRSAELFTLTVFVVALGIAILAAEVFHVSVALGAFFAGLVVGRSRVGPQAGADMAPFRDVFSALFFVSIGMLFNPALLLSQPLLVLGALGIVLLVKPLAAVAIVALLRDSRRTALTVAVGLAQIGEFSFILGALGVSLGVLPAEGMDALVIAAIASIAVNPLLFRLLDRMERSKPAPAAPPSAAAEPGSAATILIIGLNDVGRRLAQRCKEQGVSARCIDSHLERVEEALAEGIAAVFGDAARREVLEAAGAAEARALVILEAALPDKMRMCTAAREANPRLVIIALAESRAEHAWLQEFGAAYVLDTAEEMSEALLRSVRAAL